MSVEDYLTNIDPYEFEELIADILSDFGYAVEVTKSTQDRGIDIIAERNNPVEERMLVQAKAYSKDNKLGSGEIRKYATLYQQEEDTDTVSIVTTGYYTSPARDLADDLNVKVVDRNGVIEWIEESNVNIPNKKRNYPKSDTESNNARTYQKAEKPTKSDTSTNSNADTSLKNIISRRSLMWAIIIAGVGTVIDFLLRIRGVNELGETKNLGGFEITPENVYISDYVPTEDDRITPTDVNYSFGDRIEKFIIILLDISNVPESSTAEIGEVELHARTWIFGQTIAEESLSVNNVIINGDKIEEFGIGTYTISEGPSVIVFPIPNNNSEHTLRLSLSDSPDLVGWKLNNYSKL